MFRAIILPILISARLYVTACSTYNAPTMLPAGSLEAEELRFQATGRQHRRCNIPQAVTHSPVLLKMGGTYDRNILS